MHKIQVINENRSVKKSAAYALLRHLAYGWHEFGRSIRRLESRPTSSVTKTYIPDKMPPVDLPGLRFVLPVKPWPELTEN